MTRGKSSSTVTAMYGNDLSSRRRTLYGGRWRLTRFCSRCSASTSVPVTIVSISSTRSAICRIPGRVSRRAGLEVRPDARAQRLRLADVQDVALPVAEQVDAGPRGEPLQLVGDLFGRHDWSLRTPGTMTAVSELPDGPVRRVHVLPGRSGLAAAAGRGARGAQGGVRRGDRRPRAALRLRCAPTRPPASGPRSTSSSGRSRSATRISASSAPR